MGATSAVQPTIIRALKVLLPTTLPMEMSALPFRADDTLTASSGAEVPKATMVRPMTMLGMLKRLATDAAPSVRPLAPSRMRMSPPMRKRMSIMYVSFEFKNVAKITVLPVIPFLYQKHSVCLTPQT